MHREEVHTAAASLFLKPRRPGRSRGGAFLEGKSHRLACSAKESLFQAPGETDSGKAARFDALTPAFASDIGQSGPSAAGRPNMKICRMLVCGPQRRGTGEISPCAPCAECLQRAFVISAKPTGPAGGFDLASFRETPPAGRGERKGFRCQFRTKRDGIQYQKMQHATGRTPFTGGGASDAGDGVFNAS